MRLPARRIPPLALAILAILPVAGCRKKPSHPPEVIVMVGERSVTVDEFKRYLQRNAGTDIAQLAPEAASALLDQMIEEILVSEYAAAHGTDIPADRIAAAVRTDAGSTVLEKRDEMRRLAMLGRIRQKIAAPDEAAIRAYYDQHANEFNLPERVHVRQILLHDADTAALVAERLKAGASFEDMAREYSKAPNAKSGGDIGYVGRGQLPPLFENAIFALRPGSTSDVLKTDNSFHLFKVDEYAPAGPLPFDQAAATIRARLEESAIDAEMMKLVARARSEIPVRILTRHLSFAYSGALPVSDE